MINNIDTCDGCGGRRKLCYGDEGHALNGLFYCALCLAEIDKCVNCSMLNECLHSLSNAQAAPIIPAITDLLLSSGGQVFIKPDGDTTYTPVIKEIQEPEAGVVEEAEEDEWLFEELEEEHNIFLEYLEESVHKSLSLTPEEFVTWHQASMSNIARCTGYTFLDTINVLPSLAGVICEKK